MKSEAKICHIMFRDIDWQNIFLDDRNLDQVSSRQSSIVTVFILSLIYEV